MKPRLVWLLANAAYPAKVGPQWQTLQTLRVLLDLGFEVELLPICMEGHQFDLKAFASDYPQVTVPKVVTTSEGFGGVFVRLLKHVFLRSVDPEFAEVTSRIRDALGQGSRVYLEGIAVLPLLAKFPRGQVWFSSYDSYTLRLWRLATSRDNPPPYRLKRLIGALGLGVAETWALHRARGSHYVSAVDAAFMRRLARTSKPRVIPTIVEPPPGEDGPVPPAAPYYLISGQMKEPYLVAGALWFAREVWPDSPVRRAGGELLIHGGKGVEEALAAPLRGLEGVRLLGWVEEVERLYREATVVVLTDRGGTGLKNRLLMAARHARPVLGTSYALEGFELVDGAHASAARSLEDASEWSGRLRALAADPAAAKALGDALRAHVLARQSPAAVRHAWAEYLELAPLKPAASVMGSTTL